MLTAFIQACLRQWRIVVTVTAALVGLGTLAFLRMPRQEFPEFTIRQGIVVGVMPGATSAEVEEQLTRQVESYLFSYNEVDKQKTYSVSRDGQMVIFVELSERVKGPDAPAFWAKLRIGLQELRSQKLPQQVIALVGDNDFGDTSALIFALIAPGHSPRDLEKQADVLESYLRRVPATGKLKRVGTQQEVLRVTIVPDRLARYGVRPITIWSTLQSYGALPAASRVDNGQLEMPVHVAPVLKAEHELGELVLLTTTDGSQVRLRDVATIQREYGHDDSYVRADGRAALVMSVEMQRGFDVTRYGDDVAAAVAAAQRELPPDVKILRIADQPKVVRTSIDHFLRDFVLAVLSVVAVTMLLLPVRVAAVAAVTIPISIMITIGVLNGVGIELQIVSLAGLVVVLGMVVDNAIVVIDEHLELLDHGETPWTAAWRSAQELAVPVFTATLAIIAAYLPLAWFLPGTGGDFIGQLPATIAIALAVSLVSAVSLVPILNNRFIRGGVRHGAPAATGDAPTRPSVLDRTEAWYSSALQWAFAHPRITLAGGAASVLIGVGMAMAVPQQLFPKVEREQFAVEVYLPNGRALAETDSVVRQVERELKADRRVVNVTSFVGASSPRFHTVYAPNVPSRNYAQLVVNTVSAEATEELLREHEIGGGPSYANAWVRWKQLDLQSSPAPIEVRLSGTDIGALRSVASRIEAHARTIPGATWVRNDYEDPRLGIEVTPHVEEATRLGLPSSMMQLSMAMTSRQGLSVGTLWEGDYPVRVLLAGDPQVPDSVTRFRRQYLTSTLGGAAVPLGQVAEVTPRWSDGARVRRNGVRTLTVRVDVAAGTLAADVQAPLDRFIATLPETPGVTITFGGEKASSIENYVPMAFSLLSSVLAIYLILLFQFKRHRKAALVMMTMPLSLFGAILGLVLTGFPFGFTAFVGLIGLMGIVVRNGIILVDYADTLRAQQGLSIRDTALAAGRRRMRPIFLTSVAAAIGVVPMILSRSALWGPLAAVTCFGLLASMLLTLLVLPVAYWQLMERSEQSSSAGDPFGMPSAAPAGVVATLLLALLLVPTTRLDAQHAADEPLTLARSRALAVQHNASVREARSGVVAAEETRRATRANYLPSVSVTAGALSAADPLVSVSLPGLASIGMPGVQLLDRAQLGVVSAVQPLYTGGRIVNGNRLAAVGVDVARRQAALAEREAITQADEKYWQVVVLAAKERTLGAYDALLAALEKQAADAVRNGLVTRNELLKVQVQQSQATADRVRLSGGRTLAVRDLRRHLGLMDGDSLTLADTLAPPIDPSPLRRAFTDGARTRPELQLAQDGVRAAQLQRTIKSGELLPQLSLGVQALRYDVHQVGASNKALAFVALQVPVSSWWGGSHEVAAARARERIATNQLEETERLLALDLEQRWNALEVAWEQSRAADVLFTQADVNLREQTDRQTAGLIPLADLLEAQLLHRQASERRIEVRGEYWRRRAEYLRLVGGE